MRSTATLSALAILWIATAAGAGTAKPPTAKALDAHEEAFETLRKQSKVLYKDSARLRIPKSANAGKWSKVSRRIDFTVAKGEQMSFRLRRATIRSGEEAIFWVRWTELVPSDDCSDAEKAYYKKLRKKGETYYKVERSSLIRQPWDPERRDPKTNAYENVAQCGKAAHEIKGKRLQVSVLSLVDDSAPRNEPRGLRRGPDGLPDRRTPGDPRGDSPVRPNPSQAPRGR